MEVRLFGVEGCDECDTQKAVLQGMSVPFTYIDADAEENEVLCDEHDVEEVPHIQLVHNDAIVHQHIGFCDPKVLLKVAAEIGHMIK